MRYIPFGDEKPSDEWLATAAGLLNQLRMAKDVEARNRIIDTNANVWGQLKDWLMSFSHRKCWYSEAKDCFSHFEVEHYRPKKSAKDSDGTVHDGYWWLAFDWKNFRVCGNAGNRKKGTFFPLRDGCKRCPPGGDYRLEFPKLLDPANTHDPSLLAFSMDGRAVPAPGIKNAWERSRAEYTIERCNLEFPPLMEKRKTVWNECWNRIQEYREELSKIDADELNVLARERVEQAAKQVLKLLQKESELSAVARACVISTGDERVTILLQYA